MTRFTNSSRKWKIHTVMCVSIAVLFYLSILFLIKPTRISGTSMSPTLQDGQAVVVLPVGANPFLRLQRGDVVIMRCDETDGYLIKRMIALPGDTLEIRDNRVYLNDVALDEPYLCEQMVTQDVPPFTLGEDMCYVLGDNRNISADSRYFGPFTTGDIYAVVYLNHQSLLWAVLFMIVANIFVWAAYLPDWDALENDQLALPVGEAA